MGHSVPTLSFPLPPLCSVYYFNYETNRNKQLKVQRMCQYPLSLLNNLISQWTSLKSPVRVYVPSPHPSVVASLFVSMLQTKTGISPHHPSLIAESFLHACLHNLITRFLHCK